MDFSLSCVVFCVFITERLPLLKGTWRVSVNVMAHPEVRETAWNLGNRGKERVDEGVSCQICGRNYFTVLSFELLQ